MATIANTLSASLTSAAHEVHEVLQAPLEIQNRAGAAPLPRPRGAVEFQQVSVGYDAKEPVLREVTFAAEPGRIIAILGATGAGKSTLLSLIPRFYDPNAGRVLIDGRVSAREIPLDDLRRAIGLVFQGIVSVFEYGGGEYRICMCAAGNAPSRLRRRRRSSQAHDFIMELPNGYDTIIGEQGSTLSGGQRQRLALGARAIVLEPPILILDDATAAIDPETEHEIMAAMESAMKGRTTFVVAHRLSTLRRADLVLVLDRGRIAIQQRHARHADPARTGITGRWRGCRWRISIRS